MVTLCELFLGAGVPPDKLEDDGVEGLTLRFAYRYRCSERTLLNFFKKNVPPPAFQMVFGQLCDGIAVLPEPGSQSCHDWELWTFSYHL